MQIKERAKALLGALTGWMPDAMMVAGAGSISYGAGLVYPPAGWIIIGAFVLAAGWMLARGGK
jgi:hypothetical protein